MMRLILGATITAVLLGLTILFALAPNADLKLLVGAGFLLLFAQREFHRDLDK